MVNLDSPTDFNRSRSELEEFLMLCVCVAGKSAHIQARRMDLLLNGDDDLQFNLCRTPFDKVRELIKQRRLCRALQRVGMGKYHLITASFRAMVEDSSLDLWECPWERLTEIPGIKMKTAKFFVLHSRPDQQIAVLDTHIHKKLRAVGYAPPPFPPSRVLDYVFWQNTVLTLAGRAGLTPAEFDLASWLEFRRPPRPSSAPQSPDDRLARRSARRSRS